MTQLFLLQLTAWYSGVPVWLILIISVFCGFIDFLAASEK